MLAPGTAQEPPPAVQWFPAATGGDGKAWQPLLDNATTSLGRYRLPRGGEDRQQPHDRDEVYCVLAGKARFTAGGETRGVGPGDCVFVAARVEHRFHDIDSDLELVVFFSTAVPTTGGMAAGPEPTEQTPYPETSARGGARIFYWYGPDSAGQIAIDHGRPRWNPGYGVFLDRPSGKRWRCGENFWTTLDTNIPLELGGVDVPVGLYYVVLQHDQEHGLQLVLLDPDPVRERRLDAYEAPRTTGGILVPLQRRAAAIPAARLEIELTVDRDRRDRGYLRLRFGPNELHADLALHPAR
jgi:mannose-6-phosphate isomerase-like protein (cupin superfamily)